MYISGRGCGAVGRAAASDSVVQIPTSAMINLNSKVIICQLQPGKDENKEKEAGNGPFLKKVPSTSALMFNNCKSSVTISIFYRDL